MSHKYQIIMPMAGKASRFKEKGILTPKPLLDIKGTPLFQKSLFSLKDLLPYSKVTFIIHKEENMKKTLESFSQNSSFPCQILELTNRTQGPAETVLMAEKLIDQNLPLISLDCDLYFQSKNYNRNILKNPNQGSLCYFESNNSRYSYIKTDTHENVIEIMEKKVISEKALIGSYAFPKAEDVFKYIKKKSLKEEEVFLSHIINEQIIDGISFKAFNNESYYSFGTPKEFELSIKHF